MRHAEKKGNALGTIAALAVFDALRNLRVIASTRRPFLPAKLDQVLINILPCLRNVAHDRAGPRKRISAELVHIGNQFGTQGV